MCVCVCVCVCECVHACVCVCMCVCVCVCVYIKRLILAKKTFKNNDIEIIVDGTGTLWLNERRIEKKIGS